MREERRAWRPRLGILDALGAFVPATITIIAFSVAKPLVIIDFRSQLALVGARLQSRRAVGKSVVWPAA
jgi:hypothetical protein